MAYTHIDPGREIEASTRIYSSKDQDRVAELVKLPRTELAELEEASVAREKEIFAKFSELEKEWLEQAAETAAIRKAKQYLMVLPVDHTSNQWKKDRYDNYERSNMVYKMTYRVSERTHYDRARQESVTDAWCLSWYLHYNTIHNPNPDFTGEGWRIAGQSDKRFGTKEEMERYLQGRINAYAHLFTEVSPPIPKGQEGRFSVNGVLLPGYTVEASLEERVDELLSFLEDDPFPTGEPTAPGKEPPQAARKEPRRPPHRKTAPVR